MTVRSFTWDALQIVGDALQSGRDDQAEYVLAAMDADGAWDFERVTRSEWADCWFARNCHCDQDEECECVPPAAIALPEDVLRLMRLKARVFNTTFTSVDDVLRQHYPVSGIGEIEPRALHKLLGTKASPLDGIA